MKLKWKIITGAAAAFIAFSLITPPLFARDDNMAGPRAHDHHGLKGHHGFGHPGAHMKRLLKHLDLSVEQRDQVHSFMEQSKPQMREIGEQMRANQDRLSAVSPDDADYSNVVAEVSQGNGALVERMTLLTASVQSQVWAVLTDEQKAKADELRKEMRGKMQRRLDSMQQRLDATE